MGISSSRNGEMTTELSNKVAEIEKIIGYTFRKKLLLVEAITHGSYTSHPSYKRLEFVGDAVLGLAVSDCLYEMYPHIDSDDFTALRSANVSNKKLARVAVDLDLYRFLRRNSPGLDQAVSDFTVRVKDEKEGSILKLKAPKVLADMVESIAAAVYWDCNSDLKLVWKIFKKILKPFITLETVKEHPVTGLYMLCQKQRKTLVFPESSCGYSSYRVDAIVDGRVMGTGSARQVAIAKLDAAEDALQKLSGGAAVASEEDEDVDNDQKLQKQILSVYCDKKRWNKPSYKIVKEEGPAHSKQFTCSVTVGSENLRTCSGDPAPKVKYAENSAARHMLSILHEVKQPARIPNVPSAVCSWRFLFFFLFLTAFLPREYSVLFGFGFCLFYLFSKCFITASRG